MTKDTSESLIESISIPPRPEALMVVSRESKSEYPDIDKVSKAISEDVALAALVLQIINAPAFKMSQAVTNIKQAVNLLGFQRVERIVTVAALKSGVSRNLNLNRFWDSATEIATLCSLLTRKLSGVSTDDAYTLGLFHDAGIPLMMQAFDDYKQTLRAMDTTTLYPITKLEEEKYQTSHTKVGYLLLKKWYLPKHIAKALYFHHYDFSELVGTGQMDDESLSLLAILRMAEDISDTYRSAWRESEVNEEWERTKPAVLNFLGLEEDDYRDLKSEMLEWLEN